MDENKPNTDQHGHHCADCCQHGHWGGRYHLLRWLLGLVILASVFAVGVKVGELKEILKNGSFVNFEGYGHRRMMYNGNMMYQGAPSWQQAPRTTLPTTTPTPSTIPSKK